MNSQNTDEYTPYINTDRIVAECSPTSTYIFEKPKEQFG